MKVGILTLHRPANFGANLQAYASSAYIRSLGHDVRVIDYVRPRDIGYAGSVPPAQMEAHRRFVERRLPLTRRVTDAEGLRQVVREEGFDIILVGADAVWNTPRDGGVYFAQWLFADPALAARTRVASLAPAHMASSTARPGDGFSRLPAGVRQELRGCLERFCYVTVRDKWTRDIINRDLFGSRPFVTRVCADPVFRLPLLVGALPEWEGGALQPKSYIVMTLPRRWGEGRVFGRRRRRWFARFKGLVHCAGYSLVELPLPEGPSGMPFDRSAGLPLDPAQWFLWIRNSAGFCGLRFHAVVSAMACGVPFYSMDSYADKSPAAILLDVLGLHRAARCRDGSSKIARLLAGTPFVRCRTGLYLEWESPGRVFRLLSRMDTAAELAHRDALLARQAGHIASMLNTDTDV